MFRFRNFAWWLTASLFATHAGGGVLGDLQFEMELHLSSSKRLFILPGIPDRHGHRFRATFPPELLFCAFPIERVSILLGHQSVRITEKHYALWVKARQEQFKAVVRRTLRDPEPQRRVGS